jgi:primase-polymerase (primpol)-like protein
MDSKILRLEKNIPLALRGYRRFVLWRYEEDLRAIKPRKVPYYNVDRRAAVNKPKTWGSFAGVMELYRENLSYFSGIGIVLGDGIVGIDLDNVIDAEGNLAPKAKEIVEIVPGYVEKSPSGTGLHILVRGSLPAPSERKGLKFGNFEFYDETSNRYLTLTGDVWEGRSEYNA